MTAFVADASIALAWCFEDEATAWTDSLMERLSRGDRIVVPAHWPTEMSNGLLMGLRRQRIEAGRAEAFWDELAVLPIHIEPPLHPALAKDVLSLAAHNGLTVYDAAYLELAMRRNLALASLDAELTASASRLGVAVMSPLKPSS